MRFHVMRAILSILATVCFASFANASAPVIPAGQSFICTPTHVWDGDGPVWCKEGPRLRLAGIAARELDGSCSPGHPCPAASGDAARDALVTLLGTPTGVGGMGIF
jgi:endonuclease YncB( thermonuclease family)